MNRTPGQVFQRVLLIFTAVVMGAFLFTFPTRDRRGMIDRLRLKIGANHLVSKKTLKEITADDIAHGRAPASAATKLDPNAIANGRNSELEKQRRMSESVTFYCNKEYDRTSCSQWLSYCGESCRSLVHKDLWARLAVKPGSPVAVNSPKSRARR